jgi:hypothetical protein
MFVRLGCLPHPVLAPGDNRALVRGGKSNGRQRHFQVNEFTWMISPTRRRRQFIQDAMFGRSLWRLA